MVELKEVRFEEIQRWFVDFQKHSKCYEMPPDDAEIFGIHKDKILVGYFIVRGYNNGVLDIIQGYLSKEARHLKLAQQPMILLEQIAKRKGFNKVFLQTNNRFRSYTQFMDGLGYKPERLIFSKEL